MIKFANSSSPISPFFDETSTSKVTQDLYLQMSSFNSWPGHSFVSPPTKIPIQIIMTFACVSKRKQPGDPQPVQVELHMDRKALISVEDIGVGYVFGSCRSHGTGSPASKACLSIFMCL